ncbi:stalk domain-containing protein [Paenibacillus marinisediminis]
MLNWKRSRMRVVSTFTLSIILCAMLLSQPVKAEPKPQADDTYHIVGLGDSITFGYEPGMYDDATRELLRPTYGYVDRLYEQALIHGRAAMVNYSIPALTSAGLRHMMEAVEAGANVRVYDLQPDLKGLNLPDVVLNVAEIQADLRRADVIPITIGGNDVLWLLSDWQNSQPAQLVKSVEEWFDTYTDNVAAILAAIQQINPDAMIILADQYQPFPSFVMDKDNYAKLQELTTAYSTTVAQVARDANEGGMNVKVVSLAQRFEGKELLMTHMLKGDIHPNPRGYEAISELFAETIWGEYRPLKAPAAGKPMNIIVQGEIMDTPYKPILLQGKNYVSVKDIASAIGAETTWDSKDSSITVSKENNVVVMKVGSSSVQVNETKVDAGAPVFLHKVGHEAKTYVPLSLLSTGLGLDVQYSSKLRTVFINL